MFRLSSLNFDKPPMTVSERGAAPSDLPRTLPYKRGAPRLRARPTQGRAGSRPRARRGAGRERRRPGAGPGDAHAQPGLQAAILLRHPEAAPVLQRDEGLVGKARAELPEKAALEVGQHAVHVHQHPQGAAARPAHTPAGRPASPRRARRAARPPRTPAANPDHGPARSLAPDAGRGDITARSQKPAGRGARGVQGARARRFRPRARLRRAPPVEAGPGDGALSAERGAGCSFVSPPGRWACASCSRRSGEEAERRAPADQASA